MNMTRDRTLKHLFETNRDWAERIRRQDPEFFRKLATQQSPGVPVDRLLRQPRAGEPDRRPAARRAVRPPQRRQPGRAHRPQLPVGRCSSPSTCSRCATSSSAATTAAAACRPRCAATASASSTTGCATSRTCSRSTGRVSPASAPTTAAADRLCELNVIEQVANVCQTTIVQDAWERGQELAVHGWIYGLKDGLLRDLNITVSSLDEAQRAYDAALAALERP